MSDATAAARPSRARSSARAIWAGGSVQPKRRSWSATTRSTSATDPPASSSTASSRCTHTVTAPTAPYSSGSTSRSSGGAPCAQRRASSPGGSRSSAAIASGSARRRSISARIASQRGRRGGTRPSTTSTSRFQASAVARGRTPRASRSDPSGSRYQVWRPTAPIPVGAYGVTRQRSTSCSTSGIPMPADCAPAPIDRYMRSATSLARQAPSPVHPSGARRSRSSAGACVICSASAWPTAVTSARSTTQGSPGNRSSSSLPSR